MFSIIESWSTDGTFNQVSPVDNLIRRVSNPTGHVAGRTFYSLDLSAATDRLPIALQVPIVSVIYDLV